MPLRRLRQPVGADLRAAEHEHRARRFVAQPVARATASSRSPAPSAWRARSSAPGRRGGRPARTSARAGTPASASALRPASSPRRAASAASAAAPTRMRCTSGQKPMSSMRSASSSTSTSSPAKFDRVVPHVIHQPARRGDDDVDAGLERALLHVHRHAAVDGDARDRRVIGQALHLIFDLHGQLARRRQHQRARAAAASAAAR